MINFILFPFILRIFPMVKNNLKNYKKTVLQIPCPHLREQGILSIENKEFHCLGGSIYALNCYEILPFITSFQTISDYLDNLCDRKGVFHEKAFDHLHKSIIDSLIPCNSPSNYYKYYPYTDDGGYLISLVKECQKIVSSLPSFPDVKQHLLLFTSLYKDLQVYKHLHPQIRENKLVTWFNNQQKLSEGLYWWEFAAATGSTLPIFALIRLARKKNITGLEIKNLCAAYFPWIAGLHILLDYLIDLNEDQLEGDLNFVSYYTNSEQLKNRIMLFIKNSLLNLQTVEERKFHQTIVKGLLAIYLSDPKVNKNKQEALAYELINSLDSETKIMYRLSLYLRKKGIL
ncbi:tetraprenyl-beta-curcumene synthase [Anaerobranca californiensis DSM 14826]|jgi:tetraprenyl-beta-curcumene synthase|uniref:Tetraprenyl-beta-curcumene synthase n=1 Tax=Anaerobranca californiensis DSM 14826 TaxID=1120989 RepID=A0A1M6KXK9_9FIRM|nr:tetraprenyl-beta-curcumene synthase family protein [Anaerobranca californiensis]SHJ63721.1 tetraprenyl-beta-curcumene synthase [Anaerobranca californiensis DSM 14826]